jgi:hypothetical protein
MTSTLAIVDVQDVEMQTIRRSERIAQLEQLKNITKVSTSSQETAPKKKRSCRKTNKKSAVAKKVIAPKTKKEYIKKTRKVIDKFLIIETVKISDLFSLVKKYSMTMVEQKFKYMLLQTILKSLKELDIKNSVLDMYKSRIRIAEILSIKVSKTLVDVMANIEDILGYTEISILEDNAYHPIENSEVVMEDSVDCLLDMFNLCSIKATMPSISSLDALIARLNIS